MRVNVKRWVALGLCSAFSVTAAAQSCADAWDAYNEFKQRNTMQPGQHALTTYGAAVRAACGAQALPVPPGTDTPPPPRVRKPLPPAPKPADKPVVVPKG